MRNLLAASRRPPASQQPPSPPAGYNSNSAFPERTLPNDNNMLSSQKPPQPPGNSIKKQSLFARLIQPHPSPATAQLRTPSPSNQSLVEQTIDWACKHDTHLQNWPHILELSDRLSKSEPESREAVKSLKKLIKTSAKQPIQIRAIRLTVILVLNSSDRFRLLVVKKLLDVLEDVYHKSAKSSRKQPVKEILFQAFAILGHEFQHDEDLSAFTHFYNKVKPSDAPLNGTPLNASDGMFAPIPVNPTPGPPPQQQATGLYPPQPTLEAVQQTIPAMRDVREEAEIARCNARLLIEALAFTHPSEMESNEIIQEFYTKCYQSRNQLMDDIPWATEQAEHARAYYERQAAAAQSAQPREPRVGRTNPYENEGAPNGERGSSREEQLLSLLLSVNTELVDAFRQYDEVESLARAERELQEAKELSKHQAGRNNDPFDETIITPVERSEKALGKMRRFSGRSGSLAAPLGFDSNHIQLDHNLHDLDNQHPASHN
ncbi:hypothetical protein PtA15_11A673 [Puccinia triticina]|uniref:VHS domain-containing protein n=1 Tax=Puccinia triticina TaxID=208348 RepID=A0ABY7D0V2_9BASI|nr:uncharacterized protein PtA15_11A673 [Puccinia triticina]WAQ89981.1 hypothetical protein PtA15_11A673 [Puccinia triticina]WAR60018.1 hypothetical protein PtB15_11B660 [Puccinia triticina]